MILFAKSLLTYKEENLDDVVTEWVTNVETVRGNRFTIDNENKIVTIYKKRSGSGTIYNIDFIPVVMEGFEPIKPNELANYNTYWRQANTKATDDNGELVIYNLTFDIVNSSNQDVVATYTLIIDWTYEED